MSAAKASAVRAIADAKANAIDWIRTSTIFEPLPPIDWSCRALAIAPGAVSVWAGYSYVGKSIVAQTIALSVATGAPVFGRFDVAQGRARHFDYEQGQHLSRARYQRLARGLGIDPAAAGDRLELAAMPNLYLDSSGAEAAFTRELDGCRIAVIDSLRASAPGADENSSDVRRTLDLLNRASEKTGCAVILIHHARKPSEDRPGGSKMSVRGSSAIFDAAAVVWVFGGAKNQPTLVQNEKNRFGAPLADFAISIVDVALDGDERAGLRVDFIDEEALGREMSPELQAFEALRSKVLSELEWGDHKSGLSVWRKLGGNKPTMQKLVRELRTEGEIVVVDGYLRPKTGTGTKPAPGGTGSQHRHHHPKGGARCHDESEQLAPGADETENAFSDLLGGAA